MKIANMYSHLNGYEYMLVHCPSLWKEIEIAINSIDANKFTKVSKAKLSFGKIIYDQKAINKEFEKILNPLNWKSVVTRYYVASDIETERDVVSIRDKEQQRLAIEEHGVLLPMEQIIKWIL